MGKAKLIDSRFSMRPKMIECAMLNIERDLGDLYKGLELAEVLEKVGLRPQVNLGHITSLGCEGSEQPGIEAVRVLNAIADCVEPGSYLLWMGCEWPLAWVFLPSGMRVRRVTLGIDGFHSMCIQDIESPAVILLDGRESGPKASITLPEHLADEAYEHIKAMAASSDVELSFDEVACQLVHAGCVFDGPNVVLRVNI